MVADVPITVGVLRICTCILLGAMQTCFNEGNLCMVCIEKDRIACYA